MIGICAIFNNRYFVRSNRESGFGRFDIQLEPIDSELPGFIFELKFDRNNDADLNVLLEEATKQIEARRYDVDMQSRGVKEIIRLSIAFAGKRVKILADASDAELVEKLNRGIADAEAGRNVPRG